MNAHMRPNSMTHAEKEAREEVLQEFGLKEGETEFLALVELSKEPSNIYSLWRRTFRNLAYSTVLRALNRLEDKKLVTGTSIETLGGRKEKLYSPSILGDLVSELARSGWKGAAQRLAEKSTRFSESLLAHRSLRPKYYWGATRRMIRRLRLWKYLTEPNIDQIVTDGEQEWIAEQIVSNLSDRSFREETARYLNRLYHLEWMRSYMLSFLDEYIAEEGEWLHYLEDFRTKIISLERIVKLKQFDDSGKVNSTRAQRELESTSERDEVL